MAKTRKRRSKAAYMQSLHTYKKRRQTLREKFGNRTPEYKEAVVCLNKKILQWQKQIRIIEARNKRMEILVRQVKKYTGYNLGRHGFNVAKNKVVFKPGIWGGNVEDRVKRARLATCIYAKYGMENGINGRFLAEYIGRPRRIISGSRRTFNRSFDVHPENRDKYYRFIEHIENGDV